MNRAAKITQFCDLLAWQSAHELTLIIYKTTVTFPNDERFGLTSQLRRASVSITSNIAEGFGRWTPKDKLRFYQQAHGSLTEVKSQLFLARDLNYINLEAFDALYAFSNRAHALLQGLMKTTRLKIPAD